MQVERQQNRHDLGEGVKNRLETFVKTYKSVFIVIEIGMLDFSFL